MHDLEAQQLDAPDDAALRLVLADALEQRGDPRGTLIQLHHALAAATVRDERIRLRAAIRELVSRELPELAGLDLEWDLGFVRAASITDDVAAVLPRVLAHPAARLLRELTLAAGPDDVAAIAALIDARPRPSLLGRVNVGQISDDYSRPTAASPDTVAALAVALSRDPGLVVGLRDRASQAELEAAFARDPDGQRDEEGRAADVMLWVSQVAPAIERWKFCFELAIRDGCHDAVAELHHGLRDRLRAALPVRDGLVRFHHNRSISYVDLHRSLKALAPYAEDVRLTASLQRRRWVDEYAIADGELTVSRGYLEEQHRDPPAPRRYWQAQVARRPTDHDLRRFVMRLLIDEADAGLTALEDGDPELAAVLVRTRLVLDQAHELDPLDPEPWRARGQLARMLGDLVESERCFARQATLDDRPAVALDRALVAFAAHDDDRARTLAVVAAVRLPETSPARLLAAYLTRSPALLAVDTSQDASLPSGLELAAHELVRAGRHVAMVEWMLEHLPDLAARDATLRAPAAVCLFRWAEAFRLHVLEHGRVQDNARLADQLYGAAAALDPLRGDVHHRWAMHLGDDDAAGAARKLEEGLAIAPDHLGIVSAMAAAALRAHDHDRATALLERFSTLFGGDDQSVRAFVELVASGWQGPQRR